MSASRRPAGSHGADLRGVARGRNLLEVGMGVGRPGPRQRKGAHKLANALRRHLKRRLPSKAKFADRHLRQQRPKDTQIEPHREKLRRDHHRPRRQRAVAVPVLSNPGKGAADRGAFSPGKRRSKAANPSINPRTSARSGSKRSPKPSVRREVKTTNAPIRKSHWGKSVHLRTSMALTGSFSW